MGNCGFKSDAIQILQRRERLGNEGRKYLGWIEYRFLIPPHSPLKDERTRKLPPYVITKGFKKTHGLLETIRHNLETHYLCVIDDYATRQLAEGVHDEIQYLYQPHLFKKSEGMEEFRSDSVYWLNHYPPGTRYLKILKNSINSLVTSLNLNNTPKIARFTHFQISRFPENGFGCSVHVDDPTDTGCVLAVTYFSNPNYEQSKHGGVNRFFIPYNRTIIDVEPIFNRFVIHWADDRVAHGNGVCFRDLYSLSAWYFKS